MAFSFTHPFTLFLIIPAIALLIFFYRFHHITLEENKEHKDRRKKLNLFTILTRSIVLTLLLIALAQPYTDRVTTEQGDPRIKILVDNSTSMQLFEKDFIANLQNQLENYLPTELFTISEGDTSSIGDGILAHTRQTENILLISDGQNNAGADLGDVTLFAAQRNITINALHLQEKGFDNAVTILGTEKTIANVENDYTIKLSRTKPGPLRVLLEIDGAVVKDVTTTDDALTFTQAFASGYHTLHASIISYDHFPQNNEYYKVIKIVPKPKVLLVTPHASPYEELFAPLYELTTVTALPGTLTDYSAVIINDLPAPILDPQLDTLVTYLADGNGMVVTGGMQSYDAGGYKNSKLEQLLPVTIAQSGKKRGETSVVLVIDISGSTGQTFGDAKKVDVEKALAIEALGDLGPANHLGVLAFNTETYVLSNMSYIIEKNMPALEDTIAHLRDNGGTHINVGLLRAMEMLQTSKGSKNIILISDGISQSADRDITAAKALASQGVKIYTIGVGEDTNVETMQELADLTGGTYFQPSTLEKIKLIFGDSETLDDRKVLPLAVFDDNHFITQGITLSGSLYGYNVVAPKSSAKLLVTTDAGDPIVLTSRFGLGRVVTIATDDGTLYAPDLLNKQNSRLLSRIVNYALGDPERKNDYYIDIQDGRVDIPTSVTVKASSEPQTQAATFVKIDTNLYRADITPTAPGFFTLLTAHYAVNMKKEYEHIGYNPQLEKLTQATGGKLFEPADIEGIIKHAKERSRRDIIQHTNLAWIFLIAALLIYLGEICVRRIIRTLAA